MNGKFYFKRGGAFDKLYLPCLAVLRTKTVREITGELRPREGNTASVYTTLNNFPRLVNNKDIIELDPSPSTG